MAKKKGENNSEMSFLDHLEVLRWHIIRAAFGAFIFMVVAFFSRDFIFNEIILKPKNPDFPSNRFFKFLGEWISQYFPINPSSLAINSKPFNIVNIDMGGQFNSHISISIIAGLIIASPYIIWELWRFIKPALHQNEKRYASGAVFYISSLFIIGILFGYYVITPFSIDFLNTYVVSNEVTNTIKLSSYIATVTTVTFASGIIFELPIIIFFLSKIGIMSPRFMKKYRKHAYIVLLIIAGIITPPDVFSQILVSIPLILLYEISVLISRSVERKKKKGLVEEKNSAASSNETAKDRIYIDGDED